MGKRRHKEDTRTFEELTFAEQAKSIQGQLMVLQRAIRAHVRRAEEEGREPDEVRITCLGQIARLMGRLTS